VPPGSCCLSSESTYADRDHLRGNAASGFDTCLSHKIAPEAERRHDDSEHAVAAHVWPLMEYAARGGPSLCGSKQRRRLLEAVVAPRAILLIREEEDYDDEGEVVVDPYRLEAVTLAVSC
jgi:hypothetical protein